MRGTQSARCRDDLARADRPRDRFTWRNLKPCLEWYWSARERMQAPKTIALTEQRLEAMEIDGGVGSSMEDVLVTVSTVGRALRDLEESYPVRHQILVLSVRDGKSLRDIADLAKMSHQQVSIELGHAESFLGGWLRRAEVLA